MENNRKTFCPKCGSPLSENSPPNFWQLLIRDKSDYQVEEFTHVICANCGTKIYTERKFFGGLITAKNLYWILFIFFLCFMVFALREFWRFF